MYLDMLANNAKIKDKNSKKSSSSSSSSTASVSSVKTETTTSKKNEKLGKLRKNEHSSKFNYTTNTANTTNTTNDNLKKNEFKSEEDEMLAKLDMLRKLGELVKCGVKLSQKYSMESDYKAMKYEYELHKGIREKQQGIKWLSNMMINICYGLEMSNDSFNPFDFKLKGWSEQMNADVDDYYDVMGELYEKYFKTKAQSPEIKLFFMISGSAIRYHLAKTMMEGLPNLNTIIKNNPDVTDQLRHQAELDKKRDVFNNNAQKEHDIARRSAQDISYLKKAKNQLNEENTQFNKRQPSISDADLNEYQHQLNMTRSESRSAYSSHNINTNQTPNKNLNRNQNHNINQNQNQNQNINQIQNQNQNQNMQQQMRKPVVPQSLRRDTVMGNPISNHNTINATVPINQNMIERTNLIRQQEILNHGKFMEQQKLLNKNNLNYSTNVEDTLSEKISYPSKKSSKALSDNSLYSAKHIAKSINDDEISYSESRSAASKRRKKGKMIVNTTSSNPIKV
jgi:hypothetical protein